MHEQILSKQAEPPLTFSAPAFANEDKKEDKKGGHVLYSDEKKGGHMTYSDDKKEEEKKGGH
mgnify:CR=1 FL=1